MSYDELSSQGCEKTESLLPPTPTSGTYKVKYHADDAQDFVLDVDRTPVDLTLIMPHYRALNQPIDHKMSMFVVNRFGSTKLKVCRNTSLSRFQLEVVSSSADVTIWIPSDFKGRIFYTGKAKFSSGFINRVMQNAHINDAFARDYSDEDDVFVDTKGLVHFRMWDIHTGAPENSTRESLKRLFGCTRRPPAMDLDWDFLIED
ncbi:hypothetical protein AGABI1DRAFT_111606 [Agaricus bisporus var. burnettii JB137-S8]|uniref:DUF7330 domain-containing protein n=1 Tax=Agaricus bisporus var. burnettii (strain JB137-S8 / ATCC MYA-4627 / FGSC 10392) TaxID=597362 RepID=K5X5J0_AGABU|nr:uncharacterized protein AGABI1DRAFT_111606 [Agaricus bisporus var. burnettii JB137-S8]EKM83101.1 hypothetical protein AGABI1DRAFT_111606 [Agaricus bisporus var. burnettii JB137-S8]